MSGIIACHGCDLLVDVSNLPDGGRANCPRCGHFLTRYRSNAVSSVLALTIAALISFGFASTHPFLSFESAGIESTMTLWQTSSALWDYDMRAMSLLVALFIMIAPIFVLVLLAALCIPLLVGWKAPWLHFTAHSLLVSQTWVMADVFIIGVIVSLVKIASMATVTLGISFWSYIVFAVCFTLATASLDRFQFWEMIDALEQRA